METIDFNEVIRDNIEVVGGLIGTATSSKDGLMPKGYIISFSSTNKNVKISNSEIYSFSFVVYNTGSTAIVDIVRRNDSVKIYARGNKAPFTAKLKNGDLFLVPLEISTVFTINGFSYNQFNYVISEDSTTDLSDALEVEQTIIS